MSESSTIAPEDDFPFGGIITSLGHREPGIEGTDIHVSVNGVALCFRCQTQLDGSFRDTRFVVCPDGLHRPCCKQCVNPGEHLTGWPQVSP